MIEDDREVIMEQWGSITEIESMPRELWPFMIAIVDAAIIDGVPVENAMTILRKVCVNMAHIATSHHRLADPNYPHSIIEACMRECGHSSIGFALYHHAINGAARMPAINAITDMFMDALKGSQDEDE